ncbi:acyltransferase [Paenibacillus aceris]|uniref:acyltransferase n=1 Tax=Paenibacillus aceris TaxID=869555 RepID=UPI003145180E
MGLIIISESAYVSKLADIEDSVRGTQIVVGDGTKIDSFVKIKPTGGIGDVIIGSNCYLNSGVVIYSGNGVKIGNDVMIAANCTLAPVNHQYKLKHLTIREQRFLPSKGGIIIEDDVWIGANCVILDGSILRRGCVVGANSLVNTELEAYSVYVGSPAKKVGERS